jgi:hypothetical protein
VVRHRSDELEQFCQVADSSAASSGSWTWRLHWILSPSPRNLVWRSASAFYYKVITRSVALPVRPIEHCT